MKPENKKALGEELANWNTTGFTSIGDLRRRELLYLRLLSDPWISQNQEQKLMQAVWMVRRRKELLEKSPMFHALTNAEKIRPAFR